MGLFDEINQARSMSAGETVFAPAQRLDTIVVDPDGGEQLRRTDYAGTVWYGGRPQMVGRHPLPGDMAAQISAPFWLPDSHAYRAEAAASAQVQATASVQGGLATTSGGNLQILDVTAALAEHPQAAGALAVYATVTAVASLPFGVSYRVTVLCPAEALAPASG